MSASMSALAGVEAQSRNFRLISEPTIDAVPYLEDLEAFRLAVLADLDLPSGPEAEPLILSIIDDPDLFARISPGGQTAAIYLRSAAGNDIVIGYSSDPGHFLHEAIEPAWLQLVLRHETVHHILETHYARKLPIWLSEGLAEYYATYREGESGQVRFGQAFPQQDRLSETAGWLPMRTVIESMSTYPDYKAYTQDSLYRSQRLYYGQAWALAHFVLDQPGGLSAIHRFVDGWAQYGDSEDSFERAFGYGYDRLEAQMRDRIANDAESVRIVARTEQTRAPVQVSLIGDNALRRNGLRLLIRFGRLDLETHDQIETLMQSGEFGEAIANHPDIELSRALRAWRNGDWDQADQLSDAVLSANITDPDRAAILQAKALKIKAKAAYGRVSEDQLNEPLWTAAERAVDRALALRPRDASLHLFRVAVTLPEPDGLPSTARRSLDWLTARDVRLSKPHEAMMMVPALIYEKRFDRADAVLDSAARWTERPADQFVIERLRSNVAVERAITGTE